MSTTNILLSLPKEMIAMEILSRLPVKSIIRFRSVCRTFLASFSDLDRDEAFVKLHLHNAVKSNYLNIMLTGGNNQIYSVDYFDASSSSCKIIDSIFEIDYPFKSGMIQGVRIRGSCNGLVCLGITSYGYADEWVCLWNPSTTEYKIIPPPPPSLGYGTRLYSYGFGYDCASDDYKLVRMLFECVGNDSEAQVYTLGTNSWRRIVDVPFYREPGVYVDGCLHWESGQGRTIDSFCLDEEKFKELPLPTDFDYDLAKEVSVLKGCLCLVGNLPGYRTDVWVMTEYGVTWTKIFTTNHYTLDKYIYSDRVLMPCSNGEILSLSKVRSCVGDGIEMNSPVEFSCFVSYSPNEGTTGDDNVITMTVKEGILPTAFEANTCLETFVSLKSGTYAPRIRSERPSQ